VREVLSAAQRGNDVVVLDLPRAVDDVTAEVVTRCDQVLVVTDPTVAGVSAAGKVASLLAPLNDRVGLAVRRGRGALPADQVASALALPLVVEVAHQHRLAEQVDLGLGPVHSRRSALARAARAALAACPSRAGGALLPAAAVGRVEAGPGSGARTWPARA
jgi:MinD superfamily P-loop ATPase